MLDLLRVDKRLEPAFQPNSKALGQARVKCGVDSQPDASSYNGLDRYLHAAQARFTNTLSPSSVTLAFLDWSLHLANAPGRQLELVEEAARQWMRLSNPLRWIAPQSQDHRFQDDAWAWPPFNLIAQAFLLGEEWWRNATASLPGVSQPHANICSFATSQALDMCSPSNLPWINPEVLRATYTQFGLNFVRGAKNYAEDLGRVINHEPIDGASKFIVGKDIAATPGKVVFRNKLVELIQYASATGYVRAEPVLIVPAWIMKYYILDLSPHNSLIHYLVSQGYTVFCISWRNPSAEMRDMGFDDYRQLGVMAALNVIEAICRNAQVHACGYCIGGTLLSVAAAAMARDEDHRLASVTLFAAQTDFTEAGELRLFTDESQIAFLDDLMWKQGFLDGQQMAGTFQMLRSKDLIWSRMVKTYFLGVRDEPFDLMAWNADSTRLPYKMHSEYLREMYLYNDLAEGRFIVDGQPVAIAEIDAPIFAVGTETDHVAPWKSVYKIHLLNQGDVTFVLTSGGHNAGIVSEPGHPNRHFRIAQRKSGGAYHAPEDWMAAASVQNGSWWPKWIEWLETHSTSLIAPPPLGAPEKGYASITDAPGTYVREN